MHTTYHYSYLTHIWKYWIHSKWNSIWCTESLLRNITFIAISRISKGRRKLHIYLFYSRDFSYGYYIQSCCQPNNSHFWRKMGFWLQNAHLTGHYVFDESCTWAAHGFLFLCSTMYIRSMRMNITTAAPIS